MPGPDLTTWPPFGTPPPWDDDIKAYVDSIVAFAVSNANRLETITDAGGNIIPPNGSTLALRSPDGSLWKAAISNLGALTWTKVDATAPLPGGGSAIPDPGDNANLVTIGAQTKALNGSNIPRGENQLIRYTRSAGQTATPTNQYGTEVVVSLTTNQVTSVNNRIATGAGPTDIPAGSYVLSGHGTGSGFAGQWLVDYATVGATVALSASVTPPTPPPPTAGSLPAKVVSMWHNGFTGPVPWTGYSAGAKAQINMISLGMAQSAQSGTGNLVYYNRHGSALATGINAAKAAGVTVLMGIGGSSDGGITITNTTQADQCFNSIAGYVTSYGITGLDFDLEPSGSSWTETAVVYLFQKLKQTYGPSFIIGITPGLYGEYTARWLSLARAVGNNYDFMGPMLYDFPEASDSRLTTVALDKCRQMSAGGVPNSKMILGFCTGPAFTPNSTVSLTVSAYNACKAAYPGLRGAFHWDDKIDSDRSWGWATGMGPVVKA